MQLSSRIRSYQFFSMRINCGVPEITLSRFDRRQRLAHRILGRRIGDEDDRHRLGGACRIVAPVRPLAAMALHDRFQRNLLLGKARRDGRERCPACRPRAGGCSSRLRGAASAPSRSSARRADGAAERRRAHAARDVADVGDHRRRGRHAAGAGTDQRDRVNPSASMVTALVTPITCAIAESFGTMVGMHALLDALVGRDRDAEQLDAIAELVGGFEIGRRDRRDALDIDRVRHRPWCRRRGSPGSRASARCRGLRRRRSDRPRRSRAAAPPSGNRRRTASPAPCG